ncbi:hypothetical protein ABT023_16340 [Micromonospora sp. NPDC002296]|uniref:hypothetical protein n=1 Tax=Micromonospora sp. NPDC002296 TaxID=3154271 RepID=UPI00332D054E
MTIVETLLTTIAPPGYQPAAVRSWLAILHGDSPGHLHVCSTDDWSGRTFPVGQLDQAVDYIGHLDRAGREGIYVRVTSLTEPLAPGKRGSAADSAALPALWADLDIAGPGHAHDLCPADCTKQHTHICRPECTRGHHHITRELPPDEAAVRQVVAATGLPAPTLWIHSGGGMYPIWLLDQPYLVTGDNLDQARRLAKDWQAVIEHATTSLGWYYGRGVGDLARVLRVPGTINRKEGLHRPCRIVDAGPRRYRFGELVDALDAAVQRIAPPQAANNIPTPSSPGLTPVDRPAGYVSPGDDYAQRTGWADILEPAGWSEHYRQDDVTYWTRPGKRTGTSASTNALGTDRLYVFTTSALPLEGGESYSKLGAYAALRHGGDHHAAARALADAGYGTPLPDPGAEHRAALAEILGTTAEQVAAAAPPPPLRIWTPEVEVTNTAVAADWIREEAGRGKLAGLFRRDGLVVHTPREGEEGYQPLSQEDDDNDGPAQIRPVTDSTLASRITYTYGVFRLVKKGEDWEPQPALFPRSAARTALDVPDMLPNLRTLRGVIHSPVFRPDGTILATPGYDPDTRLLYLPEPGLIVPEVPEKPTAADLAAAVALLIEMIAGFPFISDHYRANYLGMLITPLLRALFRPPYKLHAIEARQPGSGKTLLANLARFIHGGVFRAEAPDDDAELRKQVTSILTITTGPVVVLDNVSGALKSSTMAGLLTTEQWDDRPLGSTAWTRATNDRIWTVTGNNIAIGGDMPRRTIRTVIDPGRPNPELRTGFAIADLASWTKERRGELLHALLVIVRSWVVAGRPLPAEKASDGYARWVRAVEGILGHAGIAGGFDHPSTRVDTGTDDDEWSEFLHAVNGLFRDRIWTAKELLGMVDMGGLTQSGMLPLDALPADLAEKAARNAKGPTGIAKSLGWWLRNRDGRWARGLTVRCVGETANGTKQWQMRTSEAEDAS